MPRRTAPLAGASPRPRRPSAWGLRDGFPACRQEGAAKREGRRGEKDGERWEFARKRKCWVLLPRRRGVRYSCAQAVLETFPTHEPPSSPFLLEWFGNVSKTAPTERSWRGKRRGDPWTSETSRSAPGTGCGTVSRVINGQPNVSDRARKRILAVMDECGYEPNSNARYLKMRSQTPVAVFVMGVGNRMFDDILGPLQAALAREEEEIVVTYLTGEVDEVRAAIDYQQARHPKGMVFLGGELESFRASFHEIEAPSVLVTANAEQLGFANLSSVTIDNVAAARSAVAHLLERGHRRVGIVGGNRTSGQIGELRLRGAEQAPSASTASSSTTSGTTSPATSSSGAATRRRSGSSSAGRHHRHLRARRRRRLRRAARHRRPGAQRTRRRARSSASTTRPSRRTPSPDRDGPPGCRAPCRARRAGLLGRHARRFPASHELVDFELVERESVRSL